MEVFVARQPIFDRKRAVVAYELLFRSDEIAAACDATDSAQATTTVKLSPEIGGAILGKSAASGVFPDVLELVRAFEEGHWETVIERAARLRIEKSAIGELYAASTLWAQQVLHATSRMSETRKNPRRAMTGTIQLLLDPGTARERLVNARLMNVSKKGVQIQLEEQLATHTYVSCNDRKLGISGTGSVRYCNFSKGKYLAGLEFSAGTGLRDPLA